MTSDSSVGAAWARCAGIVAVHDRGERDDGRLWYTMSEVRGQTFGGLLTSDAALRRQVALLSGVGALTLVTDPPGAAVFPA